MLISIFLSSIAIVLILITSILVVHLLNIKSRVSLLLALYLSFFANIVLVTEIASLFSLLNQRWFILLLHAMILVVVFFFWRKNCHGKGLIAYFANTFSFPAQLSRLFREHPLYSILALLIVGVSLFNAFIAVKVPPNTNDAMIQHLSRVGYWLQHGSMAVWNTPQILQVVYPPNAQLQILWSILFTGTDHFAPLVQWFAIPVAALAIYGLTCRLGLSREKSMLTSLLWMTLPQIILQSTSTQNDLVSTGLTICALYFLFAGIKNSQKSDILLSGLALALSIGTKQTIFFVLPAFLIIFIMLWVKSSKKTHQLLRLWVVSSVVSFFILGSIIYIQNLIIYKTPFGPTDVVSDTVKNEKDDFFRNAVLKISRITYQTFDVTEIPYRDYGPNSKSMWLYNQFANAKAELGSRLFTWLNLDLESAEGIENYPGYTFSYYPPLQIHEDITWFGPLSFLMIPAILISLVIAIKKKDKYSIGIFLIWLCLFVCLNFFKSGWTENQSRYYVLSVTCTMPLVAILWNDKKLRFWNYLVLGVSSVFMIFTILMNFCKPLINNRNIWDKSEIKLRGLQSEVIGESIEHIDAVIPENAVVGIVLSGDSFDYPLFGRHFSRILIPAYPISQINDREWLMQNEICYALVSIHSTISLDSSVFTEIDQTPGWYVYSVQNDNRCEIIN